MTESGMNQAPQSPIESVLADELARGDVVLGTAGPMLGMLLANYGHGLFSDEVVARVRGMVSHAARQLLYAQANAAGLEDPAEFAAPGATTWPRPSGASCGFSAIATRSPSNTGWRSSWRRAARSTRSCRRVSRR